MLSTIVLAILASAQISIALLVAHRGIPSVREDGRVKAFEIWLLAMSLALFAVVNIADLVAGDMPSASLLMAHVSFTAYGIMRYRRVIRDGVRKWWLVS